MKPVSVLPEADRDIEKIAEFYLANGGLDLALRFYAATEATFDRLADYPESAPRIHSEHGDLDGWRSAPVNPPFSRIQLYYLVSEHTIDVIRVMYGARDLEAILSEFEL